MMGKFFEFATVEKSVSPEWLNEAREKVAMSFNVMQYMQATTRIKNDKDVKYWREVNFSPQTELVNSMLLHFKKQ